ncbi:hypothetical protein RHECNPAF_1760026 [Rhizobium etli CNPAF512]|nr:hypothetical protein RHECNPAF_1760026 [Rhizobium etli CNPAF512]
MRAFQRTSFAQASAVNLKETNGRSRPFLRCRLSEIPAEPDQTTPGFSFRSSPMLGAFRHAIRSLCFSVVADGARKAPEHHRRQHGEREHDRFSRHRGEVRRDGGGHQEQAEHQGRLRLPGQ